MPTIIISAKESGATVLDVLRSRLRLPASRARRLLSEQRVRLDGAPCVNPARRIRRGQRLEIVQSRPRKDRSRQPKDTHAPQPVIRFMDAHVIVVDKPASLTTMRHATEAAEFGKRGQRFLPPTLADLLPSLLAQKRAGKPGKVRPVHRLDKDTSGLVVFARTPAAERHLGQQFRTHTVARRYWALVRGRAKPGRIESYLVFDRGDGRRGSTTQPGQGKRAVTHVTVLEDLGDYTAVECRLETGRTHQVRIHLGEAGTPICGERIYDRPLHGKPLPDHSAAPPLALHATRLGFEHPATGKWMEWHSPLPKELRDLRARLRRRRDKGLTQG